VNLVDPDGLIPVDTIWDLGNVAYDIYNQDEEGLKWDLGALLLPYVPAGVTKIPRVGKAVASCTKNAERAEDVIPGSLKREFPAQHLGKTLEEIKTELSKAKGRERKILQKAKKLLEQKDRIREKVK